MLSPQDQAYIQQLIAQQMRAMGPPEGYTNQKAWDPSIGVGLIKDGPTDAFYYVTSFTNLAAGASTTTTIAISADADFYCTHLTYFNLNHAALTNITVSNLITPLITVLITDTGSSRALMNAPVPVYDIAGTGQLPYRLQYPRLFQRTTSINFQWANFDSALAFDFTFVLGGFKVYSNT